LSELARFPSGRLTTAVRRGGLRPAGCPAPRGYPLYKDESGPTGATPPTGVSATWNRAIADLLLPPGARGRMTGSHDPNKRPSPDRPETPRPDRAVPSERGDMADADVGGLHVQMDARLTEMLRKASSLPDPAGGPEPAGLPD